MDVEMEPGTGKVWAALFAFLLCVTGSVRGEGGNGKAPAVAVFDGIVQSTSGGFEFPDGTVLGSAAGSYANVVVVATSGGHYASIQAALDSITDASTSNPYLVRVAPGTYSEQVTMKPFVDIQGSGELVTKITFLGSTDPLEGTVFGADDSELRFLTVENTGGADWAVAIANGGVSPRIIHVTASAQGGEWNTAILNFGGAAPELKHVRAVAGGGMHARGISNAGSNVKLSWVKATATFAVLSTIGLINDGGSTTLNDVTATASVSDQVIGIRNREGSLVGHDVRIQAVGGNESFAVDNISASALIEGGTLRAQGVTAIALRTVAGTSGPSAAELRDVSLVASATGAGWALHNVDSMASIHHSLLYAQGGSGSAAISFGGPGGSSVQVAKSQVDGGVSGPTSEIVCLGAYDENLTALDADCA